MNRFCYRCLSVELISRDEVELVCKNCDYKFTRNKTQGGVYVYFIGCKDGSIYTGSTNDVYRRFQDHKSGKGAKYTKIKGVDELLAYKRYKSRSEALKAEIQIKSSSRQRKLSIINKWNL